MLAPGSQVFYLPTNLMLIGPLCKPSSSGRIPLDRRTQAATGWIRGIKSLWTPTSCNNHSSIRTLWKSRRARSRSCRKLVPFHSRKKLMLDSLAQCRHQGWLLLSLIRSKLYKWRVLSLSRKFGLSTTHLSLMKRALWIRKGKLLAANHRKAKRRPPWPLSTTISCLKRTWQTGNWTQSST